MSGHSKWSQIKRKKAVADEKKGKAFSKLARAIELAAQKGGESGKNSELKVAIEKAKAANMPADNIERAIKKGSGRVGVGALEEAFYEAYGPGGVAFLIKVVTDNKNRTVAELKHILQKNSGALAGAGSVQWLFTESGSLRFPQSAIQLSGSDKDAHERLLGEIKNHGDVQEVFTNIKS